MSSSVNRLLPQVDEERFFRVLTALAPKISAETNSCSVLDTLEKMIEPPSRTEISFYMEKAINKLAKLDVFKEAPQNIFSLLPILHFLHGYPRPSLKEALSNAKACRNIW